MTLSRLPLYSGDFVLATMDVAGDGIREHLKACT